MATKQKVSEEEINRLKAWIEANNYMVYTVLRHASASGMQREISVVIPITKQCIKRGNDTNDITSAYVPQFVHPSYTVAVLLGRRYTEKHGHNAVICQGCGMDMGFDLVYNLSSVLYGDGYKIRQEWI